ncbi:MAG: hypothetical protein JW939_09250, partial [Candidatus Thermoplasmatota archaeon]|nr:hypothetical protein [Candidatus Thermoplasmatota archaeon]
VQETTYLIEYVFADLSEMGKSSRSYLEYRGSHYDDGILLHEYSLDLSRPLVLAPGNYSIYVTAEDERYYRSNTVEAVLRVTPSTHPVPDEEESDQKGFPVWAWMIVPVVILLAVLLVVIFLVIRRAGSGRRSSASNNPASYVALDMT